MGLVVAGAVLRGADGIDPMTTYSETFKKKMVVRMTGPKAISATALAREIDVPQPTLSSWLRRSATVSGVSTKETSPASPASPAAASRSPLPDPPATHRVRTPEDKLRLVALSVSLAEPELGAMLRREGIHAAQLEQWRDEMLAALTSKSKAAPAELAARAEDRRRIQQLEREIDRKDKALAEAAALLILQKKVREFLGDEDDATKRGRGR
jgi:transposase-like protein